MQEAVKFHPPHCIELSAESHSCNPDLREYRQENGKVDITWLAKWLRG